jgi:hypothetical protein
MLLSWFDVSEAKTFGTSLAHFYIERIPLETSGAKNKSLRKRQEVLGKMFQQMARFRLEHKLNVYKVAKLGNAFKWTLIDAGYTPEHVDQLTKELMLVR